MTPVEKTPSQDVRQSKGLPEVTSHTQQSKIKIRSGVNVSPEMAKKIQRFEPGSSSEPAVPRVIPKNKARQISSSPPPLPPQIMKPPHTPPPLHAPPRSLPKPPRMSPLLRPHPHSNPHGDETTLLRQYPSTTTTNRLQIKRHSKI